MENKRPVKPVYDQTKTKKIENSMKMLEYLKEAAKEGRRVKAKELMQYLGITNTRSIYYYRNTLQLLGYDIQSYGGYEGGYEYIPRELLTADDIVFLGKIIPAENIELLNKIKKLNKEKT